MPDDHTFFREYVFKRRPVIIDNLFEGQPIREIKSLEDAKTAFETVKLVVQCEYTSAVSTFERHTMTFREYWDFVNAHPSTKMLCTEYDIPAKVMTLFTLPSVCVTAAEDDQQEILRFPRKYGDHDLSENIFIANSGNKAQLHYDGDHRQVILYQVFGKKRVILIQPEYGTKLKPLDEPYCCASGVLLDQMSEKQRHEFIDEADGYYGTLHPGDAIYMPMLIWHHFDYIEDAMSFNLRFGRNKYGRFMSVDNFHRDYLIQNVASRFVGSIATSRADYQHAIASIITEYSTSKPNMIQRIRDMRKLFRNLCARLCPMFHVTDCYPLEEEEQHVERIMADIGQTVRYALPQAVVSSRPVGPAVTSQKQQIELKAVSYGYSNEVLEHVLRNKVGKRSLNQLTKSEAAMFLSYLRSPGATL